MRKLKLAFLSCLFASGCVSKNLQTPPGVRALVFPYGTYQHDVELSLREPLKGQPQTFHFRGVVKINRAALDLVGLSPMNTTLFRMHEDRATGKVQTDIYFNDLKKVQPQMEAFEGLIRAVLDTTIASLAGNGANGEKPIELSTAVGAAKVFFKNYDQNGIPSLIVVENPKFKLTVGVINYEL